MQDDKKVCFFSTESGACRCLDGVFCTNGWNDKCTFKKTRKEFTESSDNAILICREKGLCIGCKYYSKPCRTSTE